MTAGIAKLERRPTKLRRKSSGKRPKSSGRQSEDELTSGNAEEVPDLPLRTSCDALRSSSSTRLQLREHFSSTFPGSELSLATTDLSASRHSTWHEAQPVSSPSPYTDSELAMSSNRDAPPDMQSIDVPAAIALLQELKKHATAEELVALHKALLPTRRSVDTLETLQLQQQSLDTSSDTRYSSHRRSYLMPGLATRGGPGSDPLQTIEELAVRRKSQQEDRKRKSALFAMQSSDSIAQDAMLMPTVSQLHLAQYRPVSPSEQDHVQVGTYRTGTLRVTNRSPSPASTVCPLPAFEGASEEQSLVTVTTVQPSYDLGSGANDPGKFAETTVQSYRLLENTYDGQDLARGADVVDIHRKSQAENDPRGLSEAKIDSGVDLVALKPPCNQQTTLVEEHIQVLEIQTTQPPREPSSQSVQAFSEFAISLNAAMDEYSQFGGNPYNRQPLPPDVDGTTSPASSSCESFRTTLEPQASHDERLQRPASNKDITSPSERNDNTTMLPPGLGRPLLAQHGDSGYHSEESTERTSDSLEDTRKYSAPAPVDAPAFRTKPPFIAVQRPTQVQQEPDYQGTWVKRIQMRQREDAHLGLSPVGCPVGLAFMAPEVVAVKSPKPPQSPASIPPHSSSSFVEVFDNSPSSQRIEDIFVSPPEDRPKARRKTLFTSFGLGKKAESGRMSSDSQAECSIAPSSEPLVRSKSQHKKGEALARTKSQHKSEEAPVPVKSQNTNDEALVRTKSQHKKNQALARTKSQNTKDEAKKDKTPKKLKKAAPRHVKQARKELAKFDSQPEPPRSPVSIEDRENEETFDAQPDWFWQDDYAVPPVPKNIRSLQKPQVDNQTKWQPYPHISRRRRRNLSVVQEVDHDSLADRDDYAQLTPVPSNGQSVPEANDTHDSPPRADMKSDRNSPDIQQASDEVVTRPRAMHQSKPSIASSLSSMTSGQLELIEEVQNATIDWAVQAKFWRARRTLVGQALQQDDNNGEVDMNFANYTGGDRDTASYRYDAEQSNGEDFSSKFRMVDQPVTDYTHHEDKSSMVDESTTNYTHREVKSSIINQSRADCTHHANKALMADQPRTDYTHHEEKSSTATFNGAMPQGRSNLNVRAHQARPASSQTEMNRPMPHRYSGGFQYEWSREVGVLGSAGTCVAGGVEHGRSLPTKMMYGLDFSDIPLFITKRD